MIEALTHIGRRLMHPRTRRGRLARDATRLAGFAVVVFVWWLLTFNDYQHDARAYWALELDDLYARGEVGGVDAYLYSPAFAQLMTPLTWLPWPVFGGLWAALNLGALTWMAGPAIAGLLLVIPGSPLIDEVGTGNIHLLIAAAIVLALRWPAAWAFPLLTKVTPGVGLLWLAGARRWRSLAIALGATLLIVLVSFVLAPSLWFDWRNVLTGNVDRPIPTEVAVIPGPLWARTAIGAVVVGIGGWRGWHWTVPVAATLALPVPWSSGLTILVACIWLARQALKGTDAARG
ncbi:MAG: glycosyltransferase family 87 protein [Candidatus Limnocylindria bacterium]